MNSSLYAHKIAKAERQGLGFFLCTGTDTGMLRSRGSPAAGSDFFVCFYDLYVHKRYGKSRIFVTSLFPLIDFSEDGKGSKRKRKKQGKDMSNFWIEMECLDAASLQQNVSDLADLAVLQYNWMEKAENVSSFRTEIDCLDSIHCSNTCCQMLAANRRGKAVGDLSNLVGQWHHWPADTSSSSWKESSLPYPIRKLT